jgi:hypothetical protein
MLPIELVIQWIVRFVKNWRRQNLERQALDWPTALGTVIDAHAIRCNASESWKDWTVELSFSYVVSGEYYSGTHLLPPVSEDEAADEASRWKERKLITRFSPVDTSRSVVLMHDQTSAAIARLEAEKIPENQR